MQGKGNSTLWACAFDLEHRKAEQKSVAKLFVTKDGENEIYLEGVNVTVGGQMPLIWSIESSEHKIGGNVVLNGTNLDQVEHVILIN